MKNISVSDLKLIPQLSHLKELEFISPSNEQLIAPFLKVLGIDLKKRLQIIACQHRNLQGKVVVGYMFSGEVSDDPEFLNSSFATTEDRMIAAGYKDLGLAEDMAKSLTLGRDYGDSEDGFPPELSNPDEKKILNEISILKQMLEVIRGNQYNSDGSAKLYGLTADSK